MAAWTPVLTHLYRKKTGEHRSGNFWDYEATLCSFGGKIGTNIKQTPLISVQITSSYRLQTKSWMHIARTALRCIYHN